MIFIGKIFTALIIRKVEATIIEETKPLRTNTVNGVLGKNTTPIIGRSIIGIKIKNRTSFHFLSHHLTIIFSITCDVNILFTKGYFL